MNFHDFFKILFCSEPIKLDYFEQAVDYLSSHPKINSRQGIGIFGVSKGGELALAMAAFLPSNKIRAVIVISTLIQNSYISIAYQNQMVIPGK